MRSSKSRYNLISWVRQASLLKVILTLLFYYAVVVAAFGFAYYAFDLVQQLRRDRNGILSYMYFSLITSSTVGFGDLTVVSDLGKTIVAFQILTSTLYTAYMTAIFAVKLFYPNSAIIFSKKVLYSISSNVFMFRVINTNRDKLINPEIRISVVFSCHGDVIAPIMDVETRSKVAYLGKHDMTLYIDNDAADKTYTEYVKASNFEKITQKEDRFSINIVVTGTYGIQNMTTLHKYYAKDIVVGDSPRFIAINWTGKDIDKTRFVPPFMKYHKVTASQWKQFDAYTN